MGLLLGASAITVVELFDLFIYNTFRKLVYTIRRRRRSPSTTPVKIMALYEKDNRQSKLRPNTNTACDPVTGSERIQMRAVEQ